MTARFMATVAEHFSSLRHGVRSTLFRGNLLRMPRLRGLSATQAIRPF